MKYKIVPSKDFERNFKHLLKKYRSLENDIVDLTKELRKNPTMGDSLGNNTRKVRMTITSKGKGKRGGARVITYVLYVDDEKGKIYLLTIYDKGEQDNISEKEIQRLKQENGLL
ncbi:MAG: type II toxin-antitoxin system RelE/ParE family toxin [Dysgonamonadaceae bacterium]|jgi:mRNA-degrading endonuclease RelE of RelBE toxin-antitoxin system|nr:type II toxin-antitoxin system RelE/ParE family toxin [Dysgonamonadaceae bacterium]